MIVSRFASLALAHHCASRRVMNCFAFSGAPAKWNPPTIFGSLFSSEARATKTWVGPSWRNSSSVWEPLSLRRQSAERFLQPGSGPMARAKSGKDRSLASVLAPVSHPARAAGKASSSVATPAPSRGGSPAGRARPPTPPPRPPMRSRLPRAISSSAKSRIKSAPPRAAERSRLFGPHRRSPCMESCAGSRLILGSFGESAVIGAAEQALAECGGQPTCGFLFLSASWLAADS